MPCEGAQAGVRIRTQARKVEAFARLKGRSRRRNEACRLREATSVTRFPCLDRAPSVSQICIPVPLPASGEAVEIEVTVGGETRLMQYRVERVTWPARATHDERFDAIRGFIRDYEEGWELVQIGAPGPGSVPVTFRRRARVATAGAPPDGTPYLGDRA